MKRMQLFITFFLSATQLMASQSAALKHAGEKEKHAEQAPKLTDVDFYIHLPANLSIKLTADKKWIFVMANQSTQISPMRFSKACEIARQTNDAGESCKVIEEIAKKSHTEAYTKFMASTFKNIGLPIAQNSSSVLPSLSSAAAAANS